MPDPAQESIAMPLTAALLATQRETVAQTAEVEGLRISFAQTAIIQKRQP